MNEMSFYYGEVLSVSPMWIWMKSKIRSARLLALSKTQVRFACI